MLHKLKLFPLYFKPSPFSLKLGFSPSFICRSWVCLLLYRRNRSCQARSSSNWVPKDVLTECIIVTHIVIFYFPIPQVEHTSMSSDFELSHVTWFDQRVWTEMTGHSSNVRLWQPLWFFVSTFCSCHFPQTHPNICSSSGSGIHVSRLKTEPYWAQPS